VHTFYAKQADIVAGAEK